MGKSISDRIASKLTGRDIETIEISLDDMVDFLDRLFIQTATSQDEINAISKMYKGSWLKTLRLTTKDGGFEWCVMTHRRAGIFNLKDHNCTWVHDLSTDKFYQYRAFSWGSFKKKMKFRLYQPRY